MFGAVAGSGEAAYPPTPAMKRFADSLVRQKGIKPPPGYKTSISICRKFLSEHAPKKADGETAGKLEPKPVSLAQLLYAKKIAQGKGLVIPEEAKATRSRCLRGLIRTETVSAAGAIAKLPTSRLVQLRLNRRGQQRGLANAKPAPLLLHQLLIGKIWEQVRHCGFLMATRKSL